MVKRKRFIEPQTIPSPGSIPDSKRFILGVPLKRLYLLLSCAALCFATLLAGCGDSKNFVFTSTPTITPTVTPTPVPDLTGNIRIQLALQNNRSVKSDVRSFRVTLRQGGNVVVEQIFTRSDVGPAQTLELTDLEPGEYELQLRYLSAVGSLLG